VLTGKGQAGTVYGPGLVSDADEKMVRRAWIPGCTYTRNALHLLYSVMI
jgi:hypothetical protein